jgi:hypothetical protein
MGASPGGGWSLAEQLDTKMYTNCNPVTDRFHIGAPLPSFIHTSRDP